jgi:hypothetical protein
VAGASDYVFHPAPDAPGVSTGGAPSFLVPTALLLPGTYRVRVAAVDAAGRAGPESVTLVLPWQRDRIRRGLATSGALTLAVVGLALAWGRGGRRRRA